MLANKSNQKDSLDDANPFADFNTRDIVRNNSVNTFIGNQLCNIAIGKVKKLDTMDKPLRGAIRASIQNFERKEGQKFKCKTSKKDGSVWVLRIK